MDAEQQNTMSEPIPESHRHASRMYNSFYEAMILPGIYGKEAIQLVIAQIEHDCVIHKEEFDDVEMALYRNYIHYLNSQEVIKQANEHTR